MIKKLMAMGIVLMLSLTGSPSRLPDTDIPDDPIPGSVVFLEEQVQMVDPGVDTPTQELSPALDDAAPIPDITPEPAAEETPQPKRVEILVSFAGDCTIGSDESFSYVNSFPWRFEKEGKDYGYFFRGVKSIFEADDLTLVNLESVLTNAVRKADKKFRFKGPPEYVQILVEGSIEMVNIANNHIYDYLKAGFEETLETLDGVGILYSGEGHIAYYETNGITIASIGYGGWSTGIQKSLETAIEKARENADLVLVSFHWGQERVYYPNRTQTTLGRFAIDQGADVVVGHHPHVIQGIERYNGRYIVYSLGNFSFGGNRNPSDKDTFIFQNQFIFEGDTLLLNQGIVIPCSISSVTDVNDFQPTVLTGKDKDRVIKRLFEYSKPLKYGITPEDILIPESVPVSFDEEKEGDR